MMVVQNREIVPSAAKGRGVGGRLLYIYKYRQCNLPMCVVPCFELHHTKRNPERYL